MQRAVFVLSVALALVSGVGLGARAQPVPASTAHRPDPCAVAQCGPHGQCLREVDEAFCFCDEEHAASGLRCVPVSQRPAIASSALPSSVGMTVVHIAILEDGRDLAHVGATRLGAPGPLARFVREGGLWCSDFVSWVYRAAGVPFTGGYDGGWMLPNNAAIRAWFERRGHWVDRGAGFATGGAASFQPRPGDYVRISTTTWNHSAIVRYVEGPTLYAVEGNAGGHVHLTRYPHWRTDVRLEGFGLLTLASARAEAHRRALER